MNKRHYGHRRQFANQISNLGRHFYEHGTENVQLQVIDQVNDGNYDGLKRKEGYWQNQLMTLVEQGGMNSKNDLDNEDYNR